MNITSTGFRSDGLVNSISREILSNWKLAIYFAESSEHIHFAQIYTCMTCNVSILPHIVYYISNHCLDTTLISPCKCLRCLWFTCFRWLFQKTTIHLLFLFLATCIYSITLLPWWSIFAVRVVFLYQVCQSKGCFELYTKVSNR